LAKNFKYLKSYSLPKPVPSQVEKGEGEEHTSLKIKGSGDLAVSTL
jgi:hypothetical protein